MGMLTGHYSIMADTFKIRSYGFQELATLYLPNIQPRSASNRLRIWIKRNEELLKELTILGYRPNLKLLTPSMVSQIVRYLGEP